MADPNSTVYMYHIFFMFFIKCMHVLFEVTVNYDADYLDSEIAELCQFFPLV